MTKQTTTKTTRKQYSQEFRDEALVLAKKVGVSTAAKELGPHDSQLYGWRTKASAKADKSQVEQDQAVEIVRLKRKFAEQAEVLATVVR